MTVLQRETLRSTEGQLYRALVSWAEHWIGEGRYQSLQEAISEFIPRIEFEHMGRSSVVGHSQSSLFLGVGEFLNVVVPSNSLTNDQFRLSCLDVMQGSVRRKQETPEPVVTPGSPGSKHQFTMR